ncbi:MAG: LysE family transporter [Campylobacterota bacterium]|nr:LysE family transporter [Campylobacterota bacterium]
MFAALLQGLLLGFGACVPIGPINIIIMNYALRSYKDALIFGLGAMSADIFYLVLITFSLLQLLKESLFLDIMTLAGALFLLYLAWGIFKGRHQHITKQNYTQIPSYKLYLKGFSLTALNPYTIGFWLSVSVLAERSGSYSTLVILGLTLAILSWITLMPLSIYKSRHLLSEKLLAYFALISALILAGFGTILLSLTILK